MVKNQGNVSNREGHQGIPEDRKQVDHAAVARRLSDAMLRLHQAEGELMLALDLPGVTAPAYAADVDALREQIATVNRELAVHYCAARDAGERSLPRALAA